MIRLWGVDKKKEKAKAKATLLAGANTMLFNHNLNLSSVPFDLDLTHIQRSSFEKEGGDGGGAAHEGSTRGSTGSGSSAAPGSAGDRDKSPAAAAIHEAFGNKIDMQYCSMTRATRYPPSRLFTDAACLPRRTGGT